MDGIGGEGGAATPALALVLDTDILGIPLLTWVALILVVGVVAALGLIGYRKRRKRKLVEQLQRQRQAMEKASSDLFSQRKADEIEEAVVRPGKPKTVVSEGAVAYSETGEMLVFKSSKATGEGDVVSSVVDGQEHPARGEGLPTWSPTYRIEQVIALHITGVAMFAVDPRGRVVNGRDLDPELLVALERLLEQAKWLGGEMVRRTYKDRTVSLTWGEEMHMAAVVEGEPDERLDRELRWAIGDMAEEFSDTLWSWDEASDIDIPGALTLRIREVFNLTLGIKPSAMVVRSEGGGLHVTSTVSWRHSLAEYALGIVNNGPGPVHEMELLPTVNKEGKVEVVTAYGIDVDKDMRFRVHDIPQGEKAVATFAFRVPEPMDVRVDCTLVYRRGVAAFQNLQIPGRWVELERVDLRKGEPVEPERALELAIQHASFRDRCALHAAWGTKVESIFNKAVEMMAEHMDPVVELEDDDDTQMEAWFHAYVPGGGTVIVSLTAVPRKGIIDLFATSTLADVVPGTMVVMRQVLNRAAGQDLPEVLDPELRTTVPRMGVLLFQSWGFFDDE